MPSSLSSLIFYPGPTTTNPQPRPLPDSGLYDRSPPPTITYTPGIPPGGGYVPRPPQIRGIAPPSPGAGRAPRDLISFRDFGTSAPAQAGAFISQAPFRGSRSGFDVIGFYRILRALFGG